MKNVEKVLFFYSIIAITVIFIASAFFSPSPLSIISGLVLLPIVAYFWIRMTSPSQVDAQKWSLRLFIVVFALSALIIFAYALAAKEKQEPVAEEVSEDQLASEKLEEIRSEIESIKDKEVTDDELLAEIEKIQDELVNLRANNTTQGLGNESLSDVLDDINYEYDSDLPVGYVTMLSSSDTTADVYSDSATSSEITGQITFGRTYSFFESEGNWYLIRLPDETMGWVKSEVVEEVEEE